MLNKERMKNFKESYEDGVYFLRKIFVLKAIHLKKLLYVSVYNTQLLKWGREVYFLWN